MIVTQKRYVTSACLRSNR